VALVRVLVCDDEKDIRILYRSAFSREGAEVLTAEDGAVAVEVADWYQPHLIVLDLRMPRRSGKEALPELHEHCPDARILVVSAHLLVDHFSEMRDLGAHECFDKLDFLGRIPALVQRFAAA
jgi:DNA-binding response OmpR family regulator